MMMVVNSPWLHGFIGWRKKLTQFLQAVAINLPSVTRFWGRFLTLHAVAKGGWYDETYEKCLNWLSHDVLGFRFLMMMMMMMMMKEEMQGNLPTVLFPDVFVIWAPPSKALRF